MPDDGKRDRCLASANNFMVGSAALVRPPFGRHERLAQRQTQLLQNGYLRYYLMIIVAATVALAAANCSAPSAPSIYGGARCAILRMDHRRFDPDRRFTAIMSRSRLGAVAALGVVGYSVGLIFVFFGAPDLAMTQFMVETLTVILFVLVFYHLPRFAILSTRISCARRRDGVGFGGLITIIVSIGSGIQLYPKISDYFVENSLPLAHGRIW